MNDILKEIESMTELISSHTNAPVTDGASTDAPATDAPGTESPATDAPGTEAPATDSPATDAPTTEAPSELDELRAEIAELKKVKEKPITTKAPSTSAPTTEAPIEDQNFLGDIDLDDLTRDPDAFNKLLNAVYKKGVELARDAARLGQEGTLKAIPDIVKNNIAVVTSLNKLNKEFYAEHKDLVPWSKAVGGVFEEMIAENPDKSYEEVLKLVAPEVRKRLDLANRAESKEKKKGPKLPKKKGQVRTPNQKPETGSLASELDDMDKALNE